MKKLKKEQLTDVLSDSDALEILNGLDPKQIFKELVAYANDCTQLLSDSAAALSVGAIICRQTDLLIGLLLTLKNEDNAELLDGIFYKLQVNIDAYNKALLDLNLTIPELDEIIELVTEDGDLDVEAEEIVRLW